MPTTDVFYVFNLKLAGEPGNNKTKSLGDMFDT